MFYFCFPCSVRTPFFAELVARCASRLADGLAISYGLANIGFESSNVLSAGSTFCVCSTRFL